MTRGDIPGSTISQDPFTAGSLARLTWFLRDRIHDAHSAGHPHAEQLHDGVEDAVQGILDCLDQAARTPGPLALAPARVRAHVLWTALQAAADCWHDHPGHPGHCADQAVDDPRRVDAAAS